MSKMGSPLKPHHKQESIWLEGYTFQRYKCPNCRDIRVVTYKFGKPEMGGIPR